MSLPCITAEQRDRTTFGHVERTPQWYAVITDADGGRWGLWSAETHNEYPRRDRLLTREMTFAAPGDAIRAAADVWHGRASRQRALIRRWDTR